MFHKINTVNVIDDYKLCIQFAEGITKIYDLKQLFTKWKQFEVLKEDKELLNGVRVDTGGYGISFNDDLDLSCNELFSNGTIIKTPFDNLIAFSDATELWNLNESTLRKAASYGKIVVGIDACKYGKQRVISIDAMKREYGEPK